MNRAPSFQFYPDKFISGTLHLSDKAFKAYMRVLCWMWLHGEPPYAIPNDKNSICLASGLSKRLYLKVWENEIMNPVQPLLKIEDNLLISNGLRKEFMKQKTRRDAAKAAADARWRHKNRKHDALPDGCTPTPTTFPSPTTPTDKGEEAPFVLDIPNLVGAAKSIGQCKNKWDVIKTEIESKLSEGCTLQGVHDAIKKHEGPPTEWIGDILKDCEKPIDEDALAWMDNIE